MFCILINFNIFSLQYKFHEPKKLISIPNGYGNDKIVLNKKAIYGGGIIGPTTLTIDNNNFYIPDNLNNKILIFNENGKFIKSIYINFQYFKGNKKIKLDEDKNLIILSKAIVKIDQQGKELFIKSLNDIDNFLISINNFQVIKNEILLEKDNRIYLIDDKGIQKTTKDFNTLKITYNKKTLQNNSTLNDEQRNKIQKYLNENDLILYNDKLLTNNFSKFFDYFKINNKSIDINLSNFGGYDLIGYDKINNAYWNATSNGLNTIIIINKNGKILNIFHYNVGFIQAVDSDGNLYSITFDENYENTIIWKYERVW